MAVGDKQKLITEIVEVVLEEKAFVNHSFDWLINKHTKNHFGKYFSNIENIFNSLNGDISVNQSKKTMRLNCDAYFGNKYNFIFEFDEIQHFSSCRLKTFNFYPNEIPLCFDLQQWQKLCEEYRNQADKYRKAKTTIDFPFENGRTAQRAYLDCFRDLLPTIHKLKPTVRINEFEVKGIHSKNKESCLRIEKLLSEKIK